MPLSKEGTRISDFKFPAKFALLPGIEGPGLPDRFRKTAVSIPISPGVESLNAVAATAVALFVWADDVASETILMMLSKARGASPPHPLAARRLSVALRRRPRDAGNRRQRRALGTHALARDAEILVSLGVEFLEKWQGFGNLFGIENQILQCGINGMRDI